MRDAPNDDIIISPEAQCFENIHEQMGFVIISAEIVQRCCELGDAAATLYQLNRMACAFRAAGASYADIARIRNEVVEKRPPSDIGAVA